MTFKIKTQLQDCDIYLLDHTAAVTVDDCSNCRILTGPVASRYASGLVAQLSFADDGTETGLCLSAAFFSVIVKVVRSSQHASSSGAQQACCSLCQLSCSPLAAHGSHLQPMR